MTRLLSPLRDRVFRLLFAGQLSSNLGDALFAVALPWYVLAHHGGAVLLGTVLTAYGIPRTALVAVSGSFADRWSPWRVMMVADITRLVAVGALTLVAAGGPAHAAELIPIAIVLGAGEGLFLPGSFAIVPSLLRDHELQAGNALVSGGTQLATLVGPAIGGVVVGLVGAATAFGADGASFAISALTLAAITRAIAHAASHPRADAPGPATPRTSATQSHAERLPGIIALLRGSRLLQVIVAVTVAANLGSGAMSEIALPALAHGPLHAGAGGYGAIVAALGGGALLGTVAAGALPTPGRPAIVASGLFLIESVFAATVAVLPSVVTVASALALFGVFNGAGNMLTITAMQRWAPPALLGRVMGLTMLSGLGLFPLSVLLGGIVVGAVGPRPVFPVASAIVAVAVIASLTRSEWRAFGAARPAEAQSAATANGSLAPS